jgi:hypothetical protein
MPAMAKNLPTADAYKNDDNKDRCAEDDWCRAEAGQGCVGRGAKD